jgi:hypothetical protein
VRDELVARHRGAPRQLALAGLLEQLVLAQLAVAVLVAEPLDLPAAVLGELGGDRARARARALTGQARIDLEAAGKSRADALAELDAWLAALPPP